jgi:hypothetical protein
LRIFGVIGGSPWSRSLAGGGTHRVGHQPGDDVDIITLQPDVMRHAPARDGDKHIAAHMADGDAIFIIARAR